jgi:CRISPR-associated endonuclease Csn1
MSIKNKILRGANANLHVSFDVGHSSIGWAVLEKTSTQASDIKINGCGSVVFRADDCLASSRRAYRRQRRHIRSTRQRIARMKILLKHLGVLTEAELNPKDKDGRLKPGCAWPWKLAAQILQGGKLLTWSELWDVLRWYAHNRGYDGNQRWSNNSEIESEAAELDDAALDKILKDASATEDEKKDAEKVIEAKNLMRRHGVRTMAETFCKELGIEPKGEKKSSMKRFKGLNAAFPRKTVETEVLQILQAHKSCDVKLAHLLIARKLSDEDRKFLKSAGIRLPKRYEGGLLFGQLVPRFDNRIISNCPITYHQIFEDQIEKTGDLKTAKHIAKKLSKVPSRNCPEFLNFRWAMQLANIRIACAGEKELRPLTAAERKIIDQVVREKGGVTPFQLKLIVREKTKCVRDDLEQMLMLPDFEKALQLDLVQKMIVSDDFQPFWKLLPERLQKRLRGQWRRNKVFSLAQIRTQLESLGDTSAFDAELQRQVDAHNSKAKKIEKQKSREKWLQEHYPSKSLKLDGRAAFARHLLKRAYEEVMAGKHPKEEGGCLFISEEIRQKELNREITDQTNNHLVRHRLLILERLLKDIVKEYADGKKERIGKITIEVNRDLREMSGKSNYKKQADLNNRIKNHHAVAEKLEKAFAEESNGKRIQITAGLIRKARIAEDLGWKCPYTGQTYEPKNLITRFVDKDHIVPRSERVSDSLDSLAVTFSAVNKWKGKRTAYQFVEQEQGKPVPDLPNLFIMSLARYKQFVDSLESYKGHDDDKRRKKKRKELMLLPKYEEKEFTPRDLTQTSQLVRLGAQVLKRTFADCKEKPTVISLPGSVTGTVRKAWKVLGCLSLANPQIMEEVLDERGKKIIRAKNKKEIRDITHLHHALDACVLGLSSHFIPNNGRVWELIVKRNPNDLEKRQLEALDVFGFNAEGRFEMHDLAEKLKEQIRQRLAEKRVVQHIPARMDGLRVEQNTWRVDSIDENGNVTIHQRIRQTDGSRPKKSPVIEKATKLLGLNPTNGNGKLAKNKGVLIIPDNFGVALDPQPTVIPFHKVWTRLQELKKANDNKLPRILRNGQLIQFTENEKIEVWKIFSIKNTARGIMLDIGRPDEVSNSRNNNRLTSFLKNGLKILPRKYTGVAVCPTTSNIDSP